MELMFCVTFFRNNHSYLFSLAPHPPALRRVLFLLIQSNKWVAATSGHASSEHVQCTSSQQYKGYFPTTGPDRLNPVILISN